MCSTGFNSRLSRQIFIREGSQKKIQNVNFFQKGVFSRFHLFEEQEATLPLEAFIQGLVTP